MGLVIEFKKIVSDSFVFLGQLILNSYNVLRLICNTKIDKRELISHSARISFDAIPVVFMTTISIGVVIGIQLAPEFASRGVGNNIGIVTTIAMLREVAPIIGSLMIATQYGTGIAAEIANMKVTEQVDAMKVLGVDPLEYLVVPRFLAAVFMTPPVIFMSAIAGVAGTFIVSHFMEGVAISGFLRGIWDYLQFKDILICMFKGGVFGAAIVLISTSIGLATHGGAKEVGRATTKTVMISFVVVVLLDYIISSIYL